MNEGQAMNNMYETPRDPGLAGLLSLVGPGIGQVYTGNFLWAIFWFIITPGFWIISVGWFGWPFHILSAWQAHKQAKRHNRRLVG